MKNWKRCLISIAVVVFMVLGAQSVMATESGTTTDGFQWIYEDGTMAITGYEGAAAIVKIPSSINGKAVTMIHENAFKFNSVIKEIIIPSSVTTIDGFSFRDCTSLEKISIPNSVTSIGRDAFYSCTSLKSIVLPNSITEINVCTFEECTNLETITIPNTITSIGYHAFYGCNLKSITIPKTVTSIEDQAVGYYTNALSQEKKVTGFIINGYFGTAAEAYANSNGFQFAGTQSNLSDIVYVSEIGDKSYTGKEIKPNVVLTYNTGVTDIILGKLKEGTDYTVSYANNIKLGTATVTISGINNYKGTIKKTFEICPARIYQFAVTEIKLSGEKFAYTGAAIKPTVTVTRLSDNTILKEGTDYKVTYSNNKNIGTATVAITGINNYTGSYSTTFQIIEDEAKKKAAEEEAAKKAAEEAAKKKAAQEKITIKKAPASVKAKAKKNKVTISWKKIKKNKKGKKLLKQIKKIEVQVSLDKSFTQIVADKKIRKKKTKLKLKLQKKKTYYVRVRYVGKDGVSKWSKVKKVKTKK